MTTLTKNPTSTTTGTSNTPVRSGFASIPTRIRDVRDAQIPPLVVQPMAEQDKTVVVQSLAELGTKLGEIHRTAAEAFLSQGMYEQSLPHLEAAVTFGGETEHQMQLGFVRYITGDDVGAINTFNMVLAADSANADAWFNLAMVLFGQNQFAEAEDCFRHVCELAPNDSQTWNNRGVCLFQIGKKNDAKACFSQALRIDPQDADAKFNLGNCG
ncbi:MAG: repeat-containing protein YrrB [Planctomycetota bacterium]|jgi:Flp pilus assembly protein TadD